jgi:riboflavin synthase
MASIKDTPGLIVRHASDLLGVKFAYWPFTDPARKNHVYCGISRRSGEEIMFTGIIEHLGRVASLETGAEGGLLRVDAGPLAASLAVAGSIAVNGCCLTVVEVSETIFAADLSPETLRRTSFGEMKPGAPVNLERPLTAGKELGGHFVQGHVDGLGRVARLSQQGANWWLAVRVPAELGRYIAMKGSMAIDGISLTVAGLSRGAVEAAIIPFTYANTNLQSVLAGDPVNLEVDILAKYLDRLGQERRAPAPSRLTVERLVEEGF